MNAQILDHRTMAKVWELEPEVLTAPEFLSRRIVAILGQEMAKPQFSQAVGSGDKQYWFLMMKDLAALVGEGVNAHLVGGVVHKLGLRATRTRNGFQFYWNQAQFDLIQAAVEVRS